MGDPPKLKSWIVSLSFSPAPIWMGCVVAAEKHDATAIAVYQCMRANPGLSADLTSQIAIELTPEFLRSALRVAEGGSPEGAAVLSLVPNGADQGPLPQSVAEQQGRTGPRSPEHSEDPYGPNSPGAA